MKEPIKGFSKLSKAAKLEWLVNNNFDNADEAREVMTTYWHSDAELQQRHDEFIENTISNYYMPYGVAPNFLINGKLYTIPMAIEESSVVAAASKAAKFWLKRGGFKTQVISTTKIGQVHFIYNGDFEKLQVYFNHVKSKLIEDTEDISKKMKKRGG